MERRVLLTLQRTHTHFLEPFSRWTDLFRRLLQMHFIFFNGAIFWLLLAFDFPVCCFHWSFFLQTAFWLDHLCSLFNDFRFSNLLLYFCVLLLLNFFLLLYFLRIPHSRFRIVFTDLAELLSSFRVTFSSLRVPVVFIHEIIRSLWRKNLFLTFRFLPLNFDFSFINIQMYSHFGLFLHFLHALFSVARKKYERK